MLLFKPISPKDTGKWRFLRNPGIVSLTLSYSSEGSPALAVFRHH
jgi:hypothetical protein